MSPIVHVCNNGLKVFFFPRNNCSFVSTQLWIRMGSCYETHEEAGLAHFTEHLAFRIGPNKGPPYADQIDNAAGKMNAYTSHLNTVFFANVLKDDLSLAITGLLSILRPFDFSEEDVAKERKVILEEYAKIMSSAYQRSYERLLNRLEQSGGYKHPLIGKPEVITKISAEQIKAFRDKHYHAQNATFLISGGIKDHNKLIEYIETHTLNNGELRNAHKLLFKFNEPISFFDSDCETTFIHHVLPTGPYTQPASACAHLDQRYLKKSVKHGSFIDAQFLPNPENSLEILTSALSDSQCNDINIHKMVKTLRDYSTHQLTATEFQNTKKSYLLEQTKNAESITNVYDQGESLTSWNDMHLHLRHLECIRSLSYETYLQTTHSKNGFWYIEMSKSSRPYEQTLRTSLLKRVQQGSPSIGCITENPLRPREPSYRRADVLFPYYIRTKTGSKTFHCRISFRGGSFYETQESQGATYVLSQVLEKAIETRLTYYQVQVKAFCGIHSYGIDLSGEANDTKKALIECFYFLANPDFTIINYSQIKQRCNEVSKQFLWHFRDEFFLKKKLYGAHPYSFMPKGLPQNIDTLQPKNLLELHRRSANQNLILITYAGPLEKKQILPFLEKEVGRFPNSEPVKQWPSRVTPIFDGKIFAEKIIQTRCKVRVAYEGVSYGDDKYLSILLLTFILKLKNGPIYQRIRKQSGFVYMLDIFNFNSLDAGYFGFGFECESDKVEMIILKLNESITRVLSSIESESFFLSCRGIFEKKQHFKNQTLQSNCVTAAHNYWLGKDFEYDQRYIKEIPQMEHSEFKKFARHVLKKAPVIICV